MPIKADEDPEPVKKRLAEMLGWENSHNRYSMLGGADFAVYVEEHAAREFPERTPHYE